MPTSDGTDRGLSLEAIANGKPFFVGWHRLTLPSATDPNYQPKNYSHFLNACCKRPPQAWLPADTAFPRLIEIRRSLLFSAMIDSHIGRSRLEVAL